MVGDNIDRSSGTFKVMSPFLKSLEDGQEFFIMSVIIKFGVVRVREWKAMGWISQSESVIERIAAIAQS